MMEFKVQPFEPKVHHIVTIGELGARGGFSEIPLLPPPAIEVVYVSYLGGYNRVGVVAPRRKTKGGSRAFECLVVPVMVLLDPADVPLHLAKLGQNMSRQKSAGTVQYTAEQLKMKLDLT
ncbi:unnamed protein product [Symbiodinium natans]|uniref:Uncharacterized protein n=1 Tax=Symbiodinium natans TaxID=878477 RepID=A0A812KJ56_9DINO|nr:unnamed protein product [Symbiodinium natans]